MKNVVTFETAQRLKEAGFPQPEPEVPPPRGCGLGKKNIWSNSAGRLYLQRFHLVFWGYFSRFAAQVRRLFHSGHSPTFAEIYSRAAHEMALSGCSCLSRL